MRIQLQTRRRRHQFDLLWNDLLALLAVVATIGIVFRQVLGW